MGMIMYRNNNKILLKNIDFSCPFQKFLSDLITGKCISPLLYLFKVFVKEKGREDVNLFRFFFFEKFV